MSPLAKSVFKFAMLLLIATPAWAAGDSSLEGVWLGTLKLPGAELRIGLEVVTPPGGGTSATLVSIDQGNVRIPAVDPVVDGRKLTAAMPTIRGKFAGELSADGALLRGVWTQMSASLPLELRRVDELPSQNRPQEPKPPYPYAAVEVEFANPEGGHTLAGTLTIPEGDGPHPAVVMITGSGPQDRDETLLGHKPFMVLADALTRRGIAVLRCDDRGVGGSTGDFSAATGADLATDSLAALRFLAGREEIDAARIALCGHSEGAMLAARLGAEHPGKVAALVLLAPPAVTGEEIIIGQGSLVEKKMGQPADSIEQMAALRRKVIRSAIESTDERQFEDQLKAAIDAHLDNSGVAGKERETAREMLQSLRLFRTPWFRHFLAYDPAPSLREIDCPVLAILGGRDVQVVPQDNLPPLREALAAAPTTDVTIDTPAELNHLLQTSKSGLPAEYGMIEETIAPQTLRAITDWAAARLVVDSSNERTTDPR